MKCHDLVSSIITNNDEETAMVVLNILFYKSTNTAINLLLHPFYSNTNSEKGGADTRFYFKPSSSTERQRDDECASTSVVHGVKQTNSTRTKENDNDDSNDSNSQF